MNRRVHSRANVQLGDASGTPELFLLTQPGAYSFDTPRRLQYTPGRTPPFTGRPKRSARDIANNAGRRTMALLDRLKGILVDPRTEWPKIAAEPATVQSIYTGWVMIFAAIGPLAVLIVGDGGAGAKFAIGAYIMALIITFMLALIVDALSSAFGGSKDFVSA